MSEPVDGAIVPAPIADIRYEDEPGEVACVLILVERADGSVVEYEAQEPRDWRLEQGMRIAGTMGVRPTGMATTRVQLAVPSLSLSFTASPRFNLHIRNVRSGPPSASASNPALDSGGSGRSTPGRYQDGAGITDGRGKAWKYSEPADVWRLVDDHLGPRSVSAHSARSWDRLVAEFGIAPQSSSPSTSSASGNGA